MRFGKDGFDTKNPMELVKRTTLGYYVPQTAGVIAVICGVVTWFKILPFLVGFACLVLVPLGYIFIALLLNPRQLFLKLEREALKYSKAPEEKT